MNGLLRESRDTIFAQASARGRAGVAVIRVSGPLAIRAADVLTGRAIPPRRATFCRLKAADGSVIDHAIVVAFAAPASFSGENMVEFQLHGSLAVVAAVTRELERLGGFRPAEPGEFTRRALENGRLDLSQVEGLADLIAAETECQRVQALHVMEGGLSGLVAEWRQGLIRARALLDASMDFPDEEDAPLDPAGEILGILGALGDGFRREIDGSFAAERLREGFEVAIVGPPNVGKSTLLNALAGRDAAITSSTAGTTRDVIEVRMDVGGIPVTVLDTAGLRVLAASGAATDAVERVGIDRARKRAEAADLRIFLSLDGRIGDLGVAFRPGDIACRGKCDIIDPGAELAISGKTGEGIETVMRKVEAELAPRIRGSRSAIRERHRSALRRALGPLETATAMLRGPSPEPELVYEQLRRCTEALNSLLGTVDVEDVLDEIFSSFCMGK